MYIQKEKMNKERIREDLKALGVGYKTKDVDRLIHRYVKEKADVSFLREDVLKEQEYHRIYFYVSLLQIEDANARMEFIDRNLLFSDWWHTDQLIRFVCDLDFETAYGYAQKYVLHSDPFIRRWGYVLFISKLCREKENLAKILGLLHNDAEYYVYMAEAWLLCELAVFFPEEIRNWFEKENDLNYDISGRAIQKIQDSFRISDAYKQAFKAQREKCRERR